MKTNFFEMLNALKAEGDWQLIIKSGGHNRMLVSVLFLTDKTSDEARKLIPPMLLKGTVQELDEGFFTAIEKPVEKTATLFINMADYEKSQEAAKLKSRMEQDKQQQQKSQKDAGTKKYEAQLKKVNELQAAGKYREAYAQMPKPAEFPDYEEEINEKINALKENFDQPELFS